jgi:hypothetical protein
MLELRRAYDCDGYGRITERTPHPLAERSAIDLPGGHIDATPGLPTSRGSEARRARTHRGPRRLSAAGPVPLDDRSLEPISG